MVFLMTIFFPLWRIFTVILITGTEGFDFVPSVAGNGFGRYEIGLLCLGMMQFHFGHPKMALEVLTEAVRVSQQLFQTCCLKMVSQVLLDHHTHLLQV
ncbi:anaphase-promoting complex subunit 5-like isoform X5 [Vigna radiata var. radiata]|uniref:Anaphase-promoting complex subunit 5 n=1 Tax=Vigna radiata var. radiata TaxID=3916 RepID=A0A3Q0EK61_VIGRR|nr:anaphase-promoting complex subunit 5-like isoform X5 [Vigna radiata var. radiata]